MDKVFFLFFGEKLLKYIADKRAKGLQSLKQYDCELELSKHIDSEAILNPLDSSNKSVEKK